ncbi:sulfate/molybdate ABC transporter ATP-binding protein [Novosphingobium sp. AP12]|uniref:sulfate/molybdate ABC transporter ATP-binding protein n=1 Tax=Novosphingobium sp. AP12 TaxID=1144305 RepID=UPI0002721575|nr:sulfate/molybdate ABC transporter ATP-binding protein [Novosphingobium sp. AP12]EJL20830.1 sulfate ABC transporter, ATP-binding protein [Novosphingobium sp. AP12]
MIRVQNVTKTFGDFAALHGIDLEIKPGEFVALLGPSGSGKTTLLRIIAGLEFQDGGEVLFDGEDVSSRSVGERQVGFVFQQYALFKHMTVAENVAFGLSVRRKGRPAKADIRARAEELLRLVQLEGLGKRYPGQLSGGQRQRVALARALAIEPRLLLLDEPFGALDAKVRKDLRRWLRDLHESMGLTSIFVTHDQEEALELADRVVVMDHGRIEQVGTPEQVYMEPASPFVSNFVGETNQLPGGVHARPHDIELVGEGGTPVLVDNVFRRGGSWRVEGRIEGHDKVVEFDVDASQPAPKLGETVQIRPRRVREFSS